jgi:hypothetical protein
LEDEEDGIDGNFNITLINDPNMAEQIFKPENYFRNTKELLISCR